MTYQELLNTIPDYQEDDDDNCSTCLESGFCRERAKALVDNVIFCLLRTHQVVADEADVLQWLLDHDAIGIDQDEDVDALAKQYKAEETRQPHWCISDDPAGQRVATRYASYHAACDEQERRVKAGHSDVIVMPEAERDAKGRIVVSA